MGNSQPKYYSHKEAIDLLGQAVWDRLRSQLERVCGKYMGFSTFCSILTSHFDNMPKPLYHCLYFAFAYDQYSKVEVRDFIATLAVLSSHDRMKWGTMLCRVYDYRQHGELLRDTMERLLDLAYGCRTEEVTTELDQIFMLSPYRDRISYKDFATYAGPLTALSQWIQAVLVIFTERPPVRLTSLERRYSKASECEQMMMRYNIPKNTCDRLRHLYYTHTHTSELTLSLWLQWTTNFLPRRLAHAIYVSKLTAVKQCWRFGDFAEFCVHFGTSDIHDVSAVSNMVSELCVMFQHSSAEGSRSVVSHYQMLRLCYLLALPYDDKTPVADTSPPSSPTDIHIALAAEFNHTLPTSIIAHLEAIHTPETPLAAYITLIASNSSVFVGIKQLAIAATCLFGLKPTSPEAEKLYITELQLRYVELINANMGRGMQQYTYGPPGTQWCIIAGSWWNTWRYYVGRVRMSNATNAPASVAPPTYITPPPIDNFIILKRNSNNQLLPGCVISQHIEALAPEVYDTLQRWYDGGPRLLRTVIATTTTTTSNGVTSTVTIPELEIYPLEIRIVSCDAMGNANNNTASEMLFSRTATIQQVINEVCHARHIDPTTSRIWNYGSKNWKMQFIISPEITLEQAGVHEGQTLLLETSLSNGAWPRSQLQSQLEQHEDVSKHDPSMHRSYTLSHGRIGIDNLGNTCYMSASLQALLHTPQLVEYFLRRMHVHELNTTSKFGCHGKLALAFYSMVTDIWLQETTPSSSITPRKLRKVLCSSSSGGTFNNNDQHDAQELLSCVLDGLSEDLNLVSEKPYIEHPDSDNKTSDKELADIWWSNHLKRDCSIIQHLFSGQFKSTMQCQTCQYTSSRFEPFNFLTVPLPEIDVTVVSVTVILMQQVRPICCSVKVSKSGIFADVLQELRSYDILASGNSHSFEFVMVEVVNGLVRCVIDANLRIENNRFDNIFVYEVAVSANSEVVTHVSEDITEILADPLAAAMGEEATAMDVDTDASTPEPNVVVYAYHRSLSYDHEAALDAFHMKPVGLPIVLSLPAQLSAYELYRVIEDRTAECLKSKVSALSVSSSMLDMTAMDTSLNGYADKSNSNDVVRPIATEDAIGGEIPKCGFVLRTVQTSGTFCCRCPWISRCEGCMIPPFSNEKELLDLKYSTPEMHPSMSLLKNQQSSRLPLTKCLEKFTEDEILDDVVCPQCMKKQSAQPTIPETQIMQVEDEASDPSSTISNTTESSTPEPMQQKGAKYETMRKSISLWRLPPVLIIQLKRFQYDYYRRRKLTIHVDFPLRGLDLSPFVASTNDEPCDRTYDLYAVVNHIGALGGGHYTASVHGTQLIHGSKGDKSADDSWWYYNDSLVSLMNENEVCNSSAYVLFYMRSDIKGESVLKLHKSSNGNVSPIILEKAVSDEDESMFSNTPMKYVSDMFKSQDRSNGDIVSEGAQQPQCVVS